MATLLGPASWLLHVHEGPADSAAAAVVATRHGGDG